jgi:hypothetical protein
MHEWFYSEEHDRPEDWPGTYDVMDLEVVPPSVRKILSEPNDLLQKPSSLRHLVRVLLALGWHPRHISGLVRSKYERDYGWGNQWSYYDAGTRSDFYCRIFTDLILAGLDDLSNFELPALRRMREAAREWDEDYEPFRRSLKRRMSDDRLARWPFHRLFL